MSETASNPLYFIRYGFLAILAMLLMLLPAKPDSVTLRVHTPVTTDTSSIRFEIENHTRRTIRYPEESYLLETQTDTGWAALDVLDHAVIEPMYEQLNGLTVTEQIPLETLYGGLLQQGTYRLTFFYHVAGERHSTQTKFTVSRAYADDTGDLTNCRAPIA